MIRGVLPVAALLTLTSCRGPQRVLSPAGPASHKLAELFWSLLGWTVIPAVIVIGLALYAVHRGRRAEQGESPRDPPRARPHEAMVLLVAGALVPAAILIGLLVLSIRTGRSIIARHDVPDLTVDVVGHQFWWEVRYPDQGVTTANEIHIPFGASVLVRVTSADVIHSFWVPSLHGKLDMVPGRVHGYRIQANEPGIYRGQCAEFCGIEHARMAMFVVAEPRSSFDAWITSMRAPKPAARQETERGEAIFSRAACNLCHAVRDKFVLEHVGVPGPDLTHLGARRTLAALTLDNTHAELRAFIRDPHASKPGVRMPASPVLTDEELDTLVDWLMWEGDARP